MARRVELLLLLTGTLVLLLGSVQGWERINETQLLNLYKTGLWDEPIHWPSQDHSNYEEAHEDFTEDADTEAEGDLGFGNLDLFPDNEFVVEEEDSGLAGWPDATEGDFPVEFEDVPRSWPGIISPDSAGLEVTCSKDGFQINLPDISLKDLSVLDAKNLWPILDLNITCGYNVESESNTLSVSFSGCHVRKDADGYSLQLLYVDELDQIKVSTASCAFDADLDPRAGGGNSKCCKPNAKPLTPPKPLNCDVKMEERITCGPSGISSKDCEKKGCCKDESKNTCYYPMDECTADQNFVFAIRADGASIPVDPTKLVIPGHPDCKPVKVNDKFAIYKFKVTECGTRVYEVGEMKIYLAEIQTVVKALNLKYGIITRSDPLRFMIECRYSKCSSAKQSLASVGYMVKTPTSSLPSSIVSNGLYGVQLRIAKDKTYSSYYPTYHQPLRVLLGKTIYLELRLKSPKLDAVVLVNYCVAYPQSAKNALVLIYEGCANPNDPSVSVLKVDDLPQNRHQRRFAVNAFQFMEQTTNKYLNEEIYFMCSTEVCRPTEKKCEERCFDGKES